ncbi:MULTISPECIES: FAD-binding oxidoreductase [Brucella/Ochrobactrum group]|uniref:FAD-binding oxidoreductase n=1 Tax=Brucella pseudintermedia TaxID=370111 RepID=A0ABY5UJ04_9HYPH|nr:MULTISPECIES: FAD-binding oxidoreductase [Brucella/Ochrobactrum group]KAB2683512.1 FAD-binding oxidoreductase [Brucella pseudintermedia]NKE73967.1 FAD-binding oxidoreductase [Ochrobactrum sp. MC-1LL]TWG96555.1 FAD/FMN-containing dehydrogenase [Ochrobactrum sp. J50]UWL62836.1 FAD-binding oxidoreductase [Brucella pseudintermedia]WPM81972.1 FAD-binding oxidoreductase [Brucella pseudintermedia]
MEQSFDSFGRVDRRERRSLSLERLETDFARTLPEGASLLPFGNGCSYGDSCHNDAGFLVPMRARRSILHFDPDTGFLTAESGVLLSEIIAHVAPHGYFLPVTPGTQFVTLGGAIANDVHGKNHHLRGTFGCHVKELDLLRSDGGQYRCSETENVGLFRATISGMGLTGLILRATIRLMRVGGLDIEERALPFGSLDAYFDMAETADIENEYAVAWVDQLSDGRGLLLVGNHVDVPGGVHIAASARLGVPFELPFSALNRTSLSLFNAAYFRRKRRLKAAHRMPYRNFFYPLDSIGNWNRLYGPAGLYQHQSVIPLDAARTVIPAMLEASRAAGQVSFLTVLKRFGSVKSPGLMSFPTPGYTLTMDFPNRGRKTLDLLDRLDRLTVGAGGRMNPYKDQRMSADIFAASFPRWRDFEIFRDRAFNSNFWRRTALTLGEAE